MGSSCRGAPRQELMAPASNEFPDLKLHHPQSMVTLQLENLVARYGRHEVLSKATTPPIRGGSDGSCEGKCGW
jgi:hypothetical protein